MTLQSLRKLHQVSQSGNTPPLCKQSLISLPFSAVVHETVHRDIHHVREERITRDIHNYDVYHRMLPIVDVEVLPPRHFLPVEGGGLVEISASEVPGR